MTVLLAILAALYLGVCLLLFFVQRSLIYFPQPASTVSGAGMIELQVDGSRYAEQVTAPTLLIAAEHDEVIPASSTQALFGHFRKIVPKLTVVPAVGHNDIGMSPAYARLLGGEQERSP